METQYKSRFHFAFFVGRFVFRVRLANQGQHCAIDAGARLHNVRNKSLFRFLIKILERLPAGFLMLGQIVIGAISNAFELLAAERKIVFDVIGSC